MIQLPTSRASVLFLIVAAVASLLSPPIWAANGRITVVALSGDPTPDGDGTFDLFSQPTVNESGQVAFLAILDGASPYGVFLTQYESLLRVARQGQASPDGVGTLSLSLSTTKWTVPLNDLGQVTLSADTKDGLPIGGLDVFVGDGTTLDFIARSGRPAPGGGEQTLIPLQVSIELNQQGHVAYGQNLFASTGGFIRQIVRTGGSTSVEIFRTGQS